MSIIMNEEKEYKCPKCGAILLYDNRITRDMGIIWFYECESCDVKYPELRIRKLYKRRKKK